MQKPKPLTIVKCCEDMEITIKSGHIKNSYTIVRFSGHAITYCPFCSKTVKTK